VEDGIGESREGFDVACGNFRGGEPVIECETDCDGFLVGEVADEEGACEGQSSI